MRLSEGVLLEATRLDSLRVRRKRLDVDRGVVVGARVFCGNLDCGEAFGRIISADQDASGIGIWIAVADAYKRQMAPRAMFNRFVPRDPRPQRYSAANKFSESTTTHYRWARTMALKANERGEEIRGVEFVVCRRCGRENMVSVQALGLA